jgi:hypothetical protein
MPPEYFVTTAAVSVVIRLLVMRYLAPKDIDNDFDEDGNFVPTEEFP